MLEINVTQYMPNKITIAKTVLSTSHLFQQYLFTILWSSLLPTAIINCSIIAIFNLEHWIQVDKTHFLQPLSKYSLAFYYLNMALRQTNHSFENEKPKTWQSRNWEKTFCFINSHNTIKIVININAIPNTVCMLVFHLIHVINVHLYCTDKKNEV